MDATMKRLLYLLREKKTPLDKNALLLSPIEVEEIYGVKRATLAQWRWKRRGPNFFKLGSNVKYRMSEIEEWLEANRYKCRSRKRYPKNT